MNIKISILNHKFSTLPITQGVNYTYFYPDFKTQYFAMKSTVFSISLVVLLFLFFSSHVVAQNSNKTEVNLQLTIPPIALINLAIDDYQLINHSFSLSANHVQQIITKTKVDNTWLNYSSIVSRGSTNYITANISSGVLPTDVSLHVAVSADAGHGAGALGIPVGEIKLTRYPQNLIINIGSCYTGAGVNSGRLLNYIWENPESYNYYLNYQHGKPISVTYTITSH